jgi:hypothetical protein
MEGEMTTIVEAVHPKPQKSMTVRQIPCGFFRARQTAGLGSPKRVYLKAYKSVIDVEKPYQTWSGDEAMDYEWHDVELLDAKVEVWPQ